MVIPERMNIQGNTVPAFVVDDRFAESVKRWKWNLAGGSRRDYLARCYREGEKVKRQYLHALIWELSGRDPVEMLDHVNGDPLDNRLENLRPATPLLNSKNKRRRTPTRLGLPRGVTFASQQSVAYVAKVRHRGKKHHLGTYDTSEEASEVYENAREVLIEFANLPGYEEVIS